MPTKNKVLDLNGLKKVRQKFIGKKIVLCHGVFDLLHIGHINYFRSSKKHGNILVKLVIQLPGMKTGDFPIPILGCLKVHHLLQREKSFPWKSFPTISFQIRFPSLL